MEQGIIKINGLRVKSRLGVTDAERSNAQEVSINIRMVPDQSLFGLNDCIENTIDYFEVSESVKKFSFVTLTRKSFMPTGSTKKF